MLISSAMFAILAISITELLTTGPSFADRFLFIMCCAVLATVSMLAGMLISKSLVRLKEKREKSKISPTS